MVLWIVYAGPAGPPPVGAGNRGPEMDRRRQIGAGYRRNPAAVEKHRGLPHQEQHPQAERAKQDGRGGTGGVDGDDSLSMYSRWSARRLELCRFRWVITSFPATPPVAVHPARHRFPPSDRSERSVRQRTCAHGIPSLCAMTSP